MWFLRSKNQLGPSVSRFYWSIFQVIKSVWVSWKSNYTLAVTTASHKGKQIIKIKWYFIKISEGRKQPECSSRWILEGLKMRSEKVYSAQQEYNKYISQMQWKCLFKIESKESCHNINISLNYSLAVTISFIHQHSLLCLVRLIKSATTAEMHLNYLKDCKMEE